MSSKEEFVEWFIKEQKRRRVAKEVARQKAKDDEVLGYIKNKNKNFGLR